MKWQAKTVCGKDAESRIDKYIQTNFGLTFNEVQRLFRKNLVRIDNKKASPTDRLIEGQEVLLPPFVDIQQNGKNHQNPRLAQRLAPLIIYEDDRAVVINKPSGLPVQSGSKVKVSVDDILACYNNINNTAFKLVHRLDKSTSGVLLIAKNRESARSLTRLFKEKVVRKLYWAIVEGVPSKPIGTIELPLAKKIISGEELMTVDHSEHGLDATTRFKVLKIFNDNTAWLALEPITGRTHQLRAHCAAMGLPIVGDLKYGSKTKSLMCLHARRVSIHNYLDVMAEPKQPCFVAELKGCAGNLPDSFIELKELKGKFG